MLRTLDDPFYYLNNFQQVLLWIEARYDDLLNAEERLFIATFPTLPQAARALLVRMVMRKGTLFRAGKLVYPEIGPAPVAVQPLVDLGWVDVSPPLDLTQLFALLTKPEIRAHFAVRPDLRKAEQLQALLPDHPHARAFEDWCPGSDDRVYALTIMELCDRLRLMFFGNLHQDWSEFVLADLGIYLYEKIELDAGSRGFRERRDLDDCLHLHRCRERFEQGEALAEVLADIPREACPNPWIEQRRARLLFLIGQHCERLGEFDAALALYAECDYPGARGRRIRVLERSERFAEALALARQAEQAPESEAERQHLQRILPRLQRQLGLPKAPRATRPAVERLDLSLPRPEALSVESAVLLHLHHSDGPVHYVENTLINALFGLLCWEAIFAALPGAFFHPFHIGPADLHAPDFRQRRAALFDACLAQLGSDAYKDTIRRHYRAKQGILSPFVHWSALDDALLELALHCLPATHLRHWFERILQDIKANRAGLPDLIQFWPAQRRYRMIEVKGPGDRLQDNQLRWLDFCARHDMPVAVCYVQWADAVS